MTAQDHNKLLSIFYFIMGGLQLLGGAFMFIVYVFLGGAMMSTSSRENDQLMGGVFMGMGVVFGLLFLGLGAFTLLTGFKVNKMKPVGRTLAIIISVLSLFSFPIGTALGIYGLWFFFGDMGKNLYAGTGQGSYSPPPPPTPGNWQ